MTSIHEMQRKWSAPSSPLSQVPPTPTLTVSLSSSRHAPYTSSYIPARPMFGHMRANQSVMRNDIGEEEKQEIRMAFELFDSRKVGKLNYRELKVGIRALDFNVRKAEVKKLLEKHAKDGCEEVCYNEFLNMMIRKYKEKNPDEDVANAFRYFDEDGTGKISECVSCGEVGQLKNLQKITKELGANIGDKELETMIDEFDKDGDGEISEPEFFEIMRRKEADR